MSNICGVMTACILKSIAKRLRDSGSPHQAFAELRMAGKCIHVGVKQLNEVQCSISRDDDA